MKPFLNDTVKKSSFHVDLEMLQYIWHFQCSVDTRKCWNEKNVGKKWSGALFYFRPTVSVAPTTSSFSTWHLASIYCAKTTAIGNEIHLSLGIWCFSYIKDFTVNGLPMCFVSYILVSHRGSYGTRPWVENKGATTVSQVKLARWMVYMIWNIAIKNEWNKM